MVRMRRRQFLSTAAVASALGLAGCGGLLEESPESKVNAWLEDHQESRRLMEAGFQAGDSAYRRGRYEEAATQYANGLDGVTTLLTDAKERRKKIDDDGSRLHELFTKLVDYYAHVEKAMTIRRDAARLAADGETAAAERKRDESTPHVEKANELWATLADELDLTTSTTTTEGESFPPLAVRVLYDGEWQGAVSAGGSSRSISGVGEKVVEVDADANVVSANAQKEDGGGSKLTIQVLEDGNVVKETSTTAEYGVAQVTANV